MAHWGRLLVPVDGTSDDRPPAAVELSADVASSWRGRWRDSAARTPTSAQCRTAESRGC